MEVTIINNASAHVPYGRFSLGIMGHYQNSEVWPHSPSSNMVQHVIAPLPFLFAVIIHARDLTIRSTGPCLQTAFDNGLTLSPALIELILENKCIHTPDENEDPETPAFHENAPTREFTFPKLCQITIRSVNCVFDSTSLTHLWLCDISLANAYSILSQCPNLVHAFVLYVDDVYDASHTFTEVSLEHLELLSLAAYSAGLELLTPLRLPHLKTLLLAVIGHYEPSTLPSKILQVVGDPWWFGKVYLRGVEEEVAFSIQSMFPVATVTIKGEDEDD